MNHIDSVGELDGIHCTESVTVVIGNHFQNAGTAETLEYLRVNVLSAGLSLEESKTNGSPHLQREGSQVPFAGADPEKRF